MRYKITIPATEIIIESVDEPAVEPIEPVWVCVDCKAFIGMMYYFDGNYRCEPCLKKYLQNKSQPFPVEPPAELNWIPCPHNDSEYALLPNQMTWAVGNAKAQEIEGVHLLFVKDSVTEEWILSKFGESDYALGGIGIIGTRNWQWADSTPVEYHNWEYLPADEHPLASSMNEEPPFMTMASTGSFTSDYGQHEHPYTIVLERPKQAPAHGDLMTFEEAKAWATSQGGQLLTIGSDSEGASLASRYPGKQFWLGIRRIGSGPWQDLNGNVLTYTNWDEDTLQPLGHNYAVINTNDGKWYGADAHETQYVILEGE
jgi:hypothetical protein